MGESLQVVWDDSLVAYDFGPGHPMSPVRLALTIRLARELGVIDRSGVTLVSPDALSETELYAVHDPAYVAAVKRCSQHPQRYEPEYGLGTDDDPCFPAMHEASARIAGGSVAMARAVWTGQATHGINVAGGLHHAMRANASGFCVYNDLALAIQWLLDNGAARVAYVDVDVHHGDGVQAVFYDDPRVLTISLHEHPSTLFPGTGYPYETGGPRAEGSSVNVALPPGTRDEGWLRAFHAVVPPLLREFSPEIIVTQHGCDSHVEDPLGHLALTVDGQRMSYVALHELAHELCGGRWVATGGGGYAIVDVVPRAWTHLLAEAAGAPIAPQTPVPEGWRSYVEQMSGQHAPLRMTDGASPQVVPWERGYDPADWLDRTILATRKAVFPLHGLDPAW